MIVIAAKAEQELLQEVEYYRDHNPNQRCFRIYVSQLDVSMSEFYGSFLPRLQNLPDSYVMQVFLCHDRDVYIFVPNNMQRKFFTFIQTLAKDIKSDSLIDCMELFEIGMHHELLIQNCMEKLELLPNISALKNPTHSEDMSKTIN